MTSNPTTAGHLLEELAVRFRLGEKFLAQAKFFQRLETWIAQAEDYLEELAERQSIVDESRAAERRQQR